MPSNNQKKKLSIWLPYIISALGVILLISIVLAITGRMNFFLAFLIFSVLYVVMFIAAGVIRRIYISYKKNGNDNGKGEDVKGTAPGQKNENKGSADSTGFDFSYPVGDRETKDDKDNDYAASSVKSGDKNRYSTDTEKSYSFTDTPRYTDTSARTDRSYYGNPFDGRGDTADSRADGDTERKPDVEDYLVPEGIFGSRKNRQEETTTEDTNRDNKDFYPDDNYDASSDREEGSFENDSVIVPDFSTGAYDNDTDKDERSTDEKETDDDRNLSGRERIERVMGASDGPGSNFETIRPVSEIESERSDLSGNIESKLREKPGRRHTRTAEFAKDDTRRKTDDSSRNTDDRRMRLFDGFDNDREKDYPVKESEKENKDRSSSVVSGNTYVSPFENKNKSSGLFYGEHNADTNENDKDKVSSNTEKLNRLYGDSNKERKIFSGRNDQNKTADSQNKDRQEKKTSGFFGMIRKEEKKEKTDDLSFGGRDNSKEQVNNVKERDTDVRTYSDPFSKDFVRKDDRNTTDNTVRNNVRQPDGNNRSSDRLSVFDRNFGKTENKATTLFSEKTPDKQAEKTPDKPSEKTVRKVKYVIPSVDILRDHAAPSGKNREKEEQSIKDNEEKLISVLHSFGINANIINSRRGPSVTRYELQPEPGVKVSRILSLSDDIALSLASAGIRFEAPIPGKSAIGIEVPNKDTDIVYFKDILQSDEYKNSSSKVTIGLGKDIAGNIIVGDISKYPHLLIAGSTGSGKSVCINTIIASILFKSSPEDVRLIMIDPKVVELGIYNGIPHLLIPVVTNPKKAAGALSWAVTEVENRYTMFAQARVRDIKSYNQANPKNKIPQIVIIIDELADLMMTSAKEVEDSIIRLAQKARAAGVYLVIATQRPSVDVITGLIKANIPSRIAFAVTSYVDSRTILDSAGAEKLLGRGDMLYNPLGIVKPKRVQGAFISEDEVETLVNTIKNESGEALYDESVISKLEAAAADKPKEQAGGEDDEKQDTELIKKAGDIGVEFGQMSTSFLQRKLKLGFGRAARIIDVLEEKGVVGPQEGSKPRSILVTRDEWENIKETL